MAHNYDITIEEIIYHYKPGPGRHWFDTNTLKFFGSRLSRGGYSTANHARTYFVTSEQPPHGPRMYSVRVYDWEKRDIDTVGEVCRFDSHWKANLEAKRLAKD